MRSLALALIFAPLAACLGGNTPIGPHEPDDSGTPVTCTEMAFASVMVHTVDPDGNPLPVHEVHYRVDGGDPLPAECSMTNGAPCSTWVAGWEVAGDFEIEAVYTTHGTELCCWNEDRQTATVTVEEDACHVIQQEVTITLDPTLEICLDTACTD